MGAVLNSCRMLYLDDQSYRRVAEEGITKDEGHQVRLSEELQLKINGMKLRIQALYQTGNVKAAMSITQLLMWTEKQKQLSEGIVHGYQMLKSTTDARLALRNTAVALEDYKEKSTGLGLDERSIDKDGEVVQNMFEQIADVGRSLEEVGGGVLPALGETESEDTQRRMLEIVNGEREQIAKPTSPLDTAPAATSTVHATNSLPVTAAAVPVISPTQLEVISSTNAPQTEHTTAASPPAVAAAAASNSNIAILLSGI